MKTKDMSKMSMKSSTVITPSVGTPRHILRLSILDYVVMNPLTHTGLLFIYRPNHNNDTPSFFDANIMKAALSQVLVPFYPLAGRLKMNEHGQYEINCNEEGVLFWEAEAKESLDRFGKLTPEFEPRKWLIPSCDYSLGISSFPLLIVQLTRFSCGAVILGMSVHHHLADGAAYRYFINSWATVAKEHDLKLLPIFDRLPYLSPRHPPRISFPHFNEYGPPQGLLGDKFGLKIIDEKSPTTVSTFNLTREQVSALKEMATLTLPEEVKQRYNKLTTYEVLAAHIWRCACKARALVNDQEVRLFIPTDGRSRLKNPSPPPQGFLFCNMVFHPACIAKAGEITSNTLGYVAGKVHETMLRINDEEYLKSTVDYLESHPDKASLVREQHKLMCPNININSWMKLRFDEVDFGWGKPFHAGSAGIGYEGQTFITENKRGDGGISVSIKLFTVHMTFFKKCFYDEKCLVQQPTRNSAL